MSVRAGAACGKASGMIRIGVLNISDRASAGVYEDTPGKACVALLREWLATPFETDYKVVPDERAVIEAALARARERRATTLPVASQPRRPGDSA